MTQEIDLKKLSLIKNMQHMENGEKTGKQYNLILKKIGDLYWLQKQPDRCIL